MTPVDSMGMAVPNGMASTKASSEDEGLYREMQERRKMAGAHIEGLERELGQQRRIFQACTAAIEIFESATQSGEEAPSAYRS